MENKIASNKTKVSFPIKIYKHIWFISFLKSSAHYITSQSANYFLLIFFNGCFLPSHFTSRTLDYLDLDKDHSKTA